MRGPIDFPAAIATRGFRVPLVRPVPTRHRLARAMRAAMALVRLWHERARQRSHLAALDARMLRDIGITRSEAAREYEKPFWRG
jgi:uncharacterized protein YjiS (DUF1127 family)